MTTSKRQHNAIWPETVIIWGAGATQQLGLPTTYEIGKRLCEMAGTKSSLSERLEKAFPGEKDYSSLEDLFILLGDHSLRESNQKIPVDLYRKHYNANSSDKEAAREIERMRNLYDWDALSSIIRLCPSEKEPEKFQLTDLFNMIDMHLNTRHGFHGTKLDNEDNFIKPESLLPARNAVKMLTSLMMFLAWRQAQANNISVLHQYLEFTKVLADLMQKEGLDLLDAGLDYFDRREYYLFSYAVISLNWDPVLMWLVFSAHKDRNKSPSVPHVGGPAVPLKLFNDLGYFMGIRRVESEEPLVWFPVNEPAAQRLNDRDHITDRMVRIGKFLFPHGSTSFRECPNCGKLIVAFGDSWDEFSETLFPPPLLSSFSNGEAWSRYRRCAQEEEAFERGKADAIICSFCSTITEARHAPLIMQSSFKGEHPPFLEEIQRDMRVALENARHIVFLGYSIPEDDFIYRSIFSARKRRKEDPFCSVLNFDGSQKRGWLSGDELPQEGENEKPSVVGKAASIFGKERVRACYEGMPGALLEGNSVSPEKVRDLLYPKEVFKDSIAEMRRKELGL